MRLLIFDDYEQMSRWAARYVARRIAQEASHLRPFVLGLPTGSTPVGTYRHLVELHRRGEVSFRHVVTFNMDEYVGLGPDHPQSYAYFMHQHLWDHVDLPPQQRHIPNGLAEDLDAECRRYEQAIQAAGGIDLFLGGLGHDGHIAFNEPGSSLRSRTRVVMLTEDTRRANARFFDNDPSRVPRQALTVGVGTILDARQVMLLVSGQSKAWALHKIVEEGVNHMWAGSALQLHPDAWILCDEAATEELKVKTVRYFKEVERKTLAELMEDEPPA